MPEALKPTAGFVALALAIVVAACDAKAPAQQQPTPPPLSAQAPVTQAPDDLARLARAYPEQIKEAAADGIVLYSGIRIPYVNGGEGDAFEQRLGHASLKDQMSIAYPAGATYDAPTGDNDPGRLRDVQLFQAMYGANETQARNHLVVVRWLARQDVLVTSVNGVDKALARVSDALLKLPPEILACAGHAGTFVYRDIAGTDHLSLHSFGIAIDIGRGCSDYWYWDAGRNASRSFTYKNRMPLEIVLAFEHEGFIWGGKWAHYDTMHFEYRPELLVQREKSAP